MEALNSMNDIHANTCFEDYQNKVLAGPSCFITSILLLFFMNNRHFHKLEITSSNVFDSIRNLSTHRLEWLTKIANEVQRSDSKTIELILFSITMKKQKNGSSSVCYELTSYAQADRFKIFINSLTSITGYLPVWHNDYRCEIKTG
jgi:hypothetical protein